MLRSGKRDRDASSAILSKGNRRVPSLYGLNRHSGAAVILGCFSTAEKAAGRELQATTTQERGHHPLPRQEKQQPKPEVNRRRALASKGVGLIDGSGRHRTSDWLLILSLLADSH